MYACVCGPEEYQTPALSDHLARVLEVLSHLSSPPNLFSGHVLLEGSLCSRCRGISCLLTLSHTLTLWSEESGAYLSSARNAAGSTSGNSISVDVVAIPPLNIASKTALPTASTNLSQKRGRLSVSLSGPGESESPVTPVETPGNPSRGLSGPQILLEETGRRQQQGPAWDSTTLLSTHPCPHIPSLTPALGPSSSSPFPQLPSLEPPGRRNRHGDLSLTKERRLDTGAGQPPAGSTGLERVLGLGEGQGQGNQRGHVTAGVWVGQGRTEDTMARLKTHSDSARNTAHALGGNNDHGTGPAPCSVLCPQ